VSLVPSFLWHVEPRENFTGRRAPKMKSVRQDLGVALEIDRLIAHYHEVSVIALHRSSHSHRRLRNNLTGTAP
jgi:hypothetical protein